LNLRILIWRSGSRPRAGSIPFIFSFSPYRGSSLLSTL
jgi:hypothetical protein